MNEQPLDGGAVDETQPTDEKTEEQIYAEEVARRSGQQPNDEITSDEGASTAGDATPDDDQADTDADVAEAASDDESSASEDGADGASDEDDLAKKEQEAKRLKGTVNSQNRKITKQSQRIKELEERIASFASERPKAREIKDFDQLMEAYPDIMGPISERLKGIDEDVQRLSEHSRANAELHAERKKSFIADQEDLLSEKMEDWRDFVNTNREAFWNFVRTELTVPEAELAFASQKGVTDAEGVYNILTKARKHIEGRSDEPVAKSSPSQKPKPSRRLDGARAISSTGSQSSATDRAGDQDSLSAYQRAVKEREKNWGAI